MGCTSRSRQLSHDGNPVVALEVVNVSPLGHQLGPGVRVAAHHTGVPRRAADALQRVPLHGGEHEEDRHAAVGNDVADDGVPARARDLGVDAEAEGGVGHRLCEEVEVGRVDREAGVRRQGGNGIVSRVADVVGVDIDPVNAGQGRQPPRQVLRQHVALGEAAAERHRHRRGAAAVREEGGQQLGVQQLKRFGKSFFDLSVGA
eukprot:EG_transcript_13682